MSKYRITEKHPQLGEVEHIFANKKMAERWIKLTVDNLFNAAYRQVGEEKAREQSELRGKMLRDSLEERDSKLEDWGDQASPLLG